MNLTTRDYPTHPHLFGSSTASEAIVSLYEKEQTLLPSKNYDLSMELCLFHPWEEDFIKNLFEEAELYSKFQIIQEFATKLIENTEDLNPKYAKLVNKHFWDLI